jgi:aldose 1-epimerase
MEISKFSFGETQEQEIVEGYQISNKSGNSVKIINWGATLISLKVPDRNGIVEEVTLGFDNISDYEDHSPYFGSTIGRVGNRIKNGRFTLDGVEYALDKNTGDVAQLHGGKKGFSKVIWKLSTVLEESQGTVICKYLSKDGEEGYPGNLNVEVKYVLTDLNELIIDYRATTDKACPVNLTNHAYWNLCGNNRDSILNHNLQLKCNHYLPIDNDLIPTGELKSVENTPWDFRKTKPIGQDIDLAGDYDHCFVMGSEQGDFLQFAEVHEPSSGRTMTVSTTEPGVQLYTGNFLYQLEEKGFKKYDAFCLETQFFPNAPNQKNFPSIILSPEAEYYQKTIHTFGVAP